MAVNKTLMIAVAVVAAIAVGGIAAFFLLQEEEYSIEYDLDGGEFCSDYPKTYKTGDIIDLQYPIKDGRTFAGWYTDADTTVFFNGDTHGIKGPLKLFARWTASPSGYHFRYTIQEDCDRGLSSYRMSGDRAAYYDMISHRTGLFHTAIVDMARYDYYEVHDELIKVVQDEGWNPGFGNWGYKGVETIDTMDGVKTCEVYGRQYDDGATETRWIDDNGIIYKEYYEYIGDDDSDMKSKIATRVLNYYRITGWSEEYTVEVRAGVGIDVTGLKEKYLPGELVTLKAEVGPGVTFSGWYDTNMNLLCDDTTYEFEAGFSQIVYAMNSLDEKYHYMAGEDIDFSKIFGTKKGTRYTAYKEGNIMGASWNTPVFNGLESGFYIIVAKTPEGQELEVLMQIGGKVHRDYQWNWNGDTYAVGLDIGYDDYRYAKDLYDLGERRQYKPDHVHDKTFVTIGYEDERMSKYTAELVDSLIAAFKEKNPRVTEKDYLNYLLAFTQYIPYKTDEEFLGFKEYWKFPLETLFDKSGDCEDTSILFVLLAHESREKLGFGYEVGLQIMPGHVCAAVKTSSVSAKTNPFGYIYGETTALDYDIGDIPSKMKDGFLDEEYYPPNTKSFLVEIE